MPFVQKLGFITGILLSAIFLSISVIVISWSLGVLAGILARGFWWAWTS